MTVRNTLIASTAAAALTLGAAGGALADAHKGDMQDDKQLKVIYSDTWEPGFQKGDDGRYYKLTKVETEEPDQVLQIKRSETYKEGWKKADDGGYYTLSSAEPMDKDTELEVVYSDTWKPGYLKGDDGRYYKLMKQPRTE